MKKIFYLFLLFSISVFSQSDVLQKEDVNTSKGNGGSSVGIGANINESTGKLSESLPVAEIKCRTLSYPFAVSYDGTNIFKQAQYQNRYFPTGIMGVGWSMGVPKIVADIKETAARDDDTFYLNGVELVCVKRPLRTFYANGVQIWEFKPKKQMPYRIRYFEYSGGIVGGTYQEQVLDYWEVIDEKGRIYVYGNTDNTRENVIAWGNWIGDSKLITGLESKHTVAWNLSQIKDQWNNQLNFSYLKTEQRVNTTGLFHTEASYLSQVTSGTGEKIVLSYSLKNSYEYYEPHTEAPEPDAYQERYEKYYLNNIKVYNSANTVVLTTSFGYTIASASGNDNRKRYMTQVTKTNTIGQSLPPQRYEYFTTGVFAGALKKKTNPQGGSVTYTYEEKTLFTNATNNTNYNGLTGLPNSRQFARYYGNNYSLALCTHEDNLLPAFTVGEGNVGMYIDYSVWNGRNWSMSRTFMPQKVRVLTDWNGSYRVDNIKFVFEDNFFAALCFDRVTRKGELHLFHLKEDGTWRYEQIANIDTDGSGNKNNADADPVLLSSDGFVSIGTIRGKLFTYVWNNLIWKRKTIDQGDGEYYYAAKNNFVLAMNLKTGVDMPIMGNTTTQQYYDRYYIHYLDSEKKWMTKSWSSFATTNIGNISGKSYFYPNNSMSSFVAADNPELLIRWSPNYDLISVADDILGAHNDNYPFLSVGNNIFAGWRCGDIGKPYIFKAAAISGFSEFATPEVNMQTFQGFGNNKLLGSRWNGVVNDYSHDLRKFNPNTNVWETYNLTFPPKEHNNHYSHSYAFGNDIFIAGLNMYKENNNTFSNLGQVTSHDYTSFANSGGDYIYAAFWTKDPVFNGGNPTGETKYFYIDKKDGLLKNQIVHSSYVNDNLNRNMFAEQFGGKFPFYARRNFEGRRIIDNKYGNVITDIVISQIAADNGNGLVVNTSYTYENSNSSPDDATVVYGTVTIKEIGNGTGNNGAIKKYYNNGVLDWTKAGLLDREEYWDASNFKAKEIINTYTKFDFPVWSSNASNGVTHYVTVWQKTNVEERANFIGSGTIVTNVESRFDPNGNLFFTSKLNSEGKLQTTEIMYAENYFSFVANKNFIGFPYMKINRVGNTVVSAEQIKWTQNGDKVYINENLSGINDNLLRTNDKIEVVDNYGNIVQTSNGKGLHKSILMGYNYKYPVATITNVTQADAIAALDISYAALQGLSVANLKLELLKLYNHVNLSKKAMIKIDIYDANGNIVTSIDERKNEVNYIYDEFYRLKYVTDKSNHIIQHKKYHYKN
ncbi:hypothetical protein ACI6PS_07940 [Flavobacterium sp. PLA-1-15]|uniref:hypothetical protein n=1 Tax=Flavobacterium sp. PLA-1-15 TaxID=3380533 RepID=UPI003B797CD6